MPYVVQPAGSREAAMAGAQLRWKAIAERTPELGPAVTLQQDLIGVVADLANTIERSRLPRLSLPPRYVAAKLGQGIPVLAGEPVPVPVSLLKPGLMQLCDALERGGAGESAAHIRESLDETRLETASLLTASLKRDQAAIRTGANHRGLSPDLMWLVAELAVTPFVHALQQAIFPPAVDPTLTSALGSWARGYCPFCGSWPALAEVVERRTLRCSFCALAWDLPTYACVYCSHHGADFITAAPDLDRKDRRLELCKSCGGYMKTVDVPALTPFPLLPVADLETMDLDMAAMERGFGRPQMKDFSKKHT